MYVIIISYNYITTFFKGSRERYLSWLKGQLLMRCSFFTVGYGFLLEPLRAFVIDIFPLLKTFTNCCLNLYVTWSAKYFRKQDRKCLLSLLLNVLYESHYMHCVYRFLLSIVINFLKLQNIGISDKRGCHYYFKSPLFLYVWFKGEEHSSFQQVGLPCCLFFSFLFFFRSCFHYDQISLLFFFWRATFQNQKVMVTTSLPSSVYFKLQTVLNIWPLIDNARPFSTRYLRLSEQNKFSNEKLQNHVFRLLINTTN